MTARIKTHLIFLPLAISMSLLSPSKSAATEKHLYFLGGGGEPTGKKTMFDRNIESFSDFTNKSDWKTTISFNGAHSTTEDLLKSNFKNANQLGDFNEVHVNEALRDITTKINQGTLKKGDQLMIVIDTHGMEGSNPGQKTHDIVLSTQGRSNGAQTFSMDRMKTIMDLARQKGVKLAIVENSCYSGNTQAINDENTCLITSTGSAHPAFGGGQKLMFFFNYSTHFSGRLYKQMQPGKNLEEIYLAARRDSDNPDFPMISTPEGRETQKKLYKLISPFLNFNIVGYEGFEKMYSRKNIDQISCQFDNNFAKLKSFIEEHEATLGHLKTEPLKKALEDYRNYQKKYETELQEVNKAEAEIKNILEKDFSDQKNLWKDQEPIAFLSANYEGNLKTFQGLLDSCKPHEVDAKKRMQELVDLTKQQIKVRDGIAARLSSQAHGHLQGQKYIAHSQEETFNLANKVGLESKKLYDQLYLQNMQIRQRQAMAKGETKSNACRDFQL